MSRTLNKATIIGFLGKDPETRRTQEGDPVVSFSVATSERWKNKETGERKERKEWHKVVIYNIPLCKIAEEYLKKGSHVYIEGQLQTRSWTSEDGHENYRTEIVLQPYRGVLNLLDPNNAPDNADESESDQS